MGQTPSAIADLPDVNTAYNALFNQIDQRVYFSKLAQAGFSPRTEKEAEYLLRIGAQLEATSEHETVKQAEEENNPYYKAAAALDRFLGQNGLNGADVQRRTYEQNLSITKTAEALAQDPMLYNSVLVLKAAEAAEAAGL